MAVMARKTTVLLLVLVATAVLLCSVVPPAEAARKNLVGPQSQTATDGANGADAAGIPGDNASDVTKGGLGGSQGITSNNDVAGVAGGVAKSLGGVTAGSGGADAGSDGGAIGGAGANSIVRKAH